MAQDQTLKEIGGLVAQVTNAIVATVKRPLIGGFGLLQTLAAVKDIDFARARTELLAADPSVYTDVEAAFNAKLDVGDDKVKAKVLEVEGALDAAFAVAQHAAGVYKAGVSVYSEVVSLVAKVKTLVGV